MNARKYNRGTRRPRTHRTGPRRAASAGSGQGCLLLVVAEAGIMLGLLYAAALAAGLI